MKTKGTHKVRLADLQENLFVRKALDQDHALYLAELIESGIEMKEPIEVAEVKSPDGDTYLTIVDGRHRKHAYDLNDVEEVRVRVLEFKDETEMIAYAYQKNTGGSKPPTQEDTEHTVAILLQRRVAKKHIAGILNVPPSLARKYINLVQSKLERQKVTRAAAAVREGGLTVSKAAAQYDVDLTKLKAALGGKKKPPKHGVEETQRNLTKAYKSLGLKTAAAIRRLLEKLEEGDVTEKQVEAIFDHIDRLQKQSSRAVVGWRKRFEAKIAEIA